MIPNDGFPSLPSGPSSLCRSSRLLPTLNQISAIQLHQNLLGQRFLNYSSNSWVGRHLSFPSDIETFPAVTLTRITFGTGDWMGNGRRNSCDSLSFVSDEKDSEEEVSSIEWECVRMSEQEEDLIYRMYRLVGNRWELIAGRIPGRTTGEIERFWIMRNGELSLLINGPKR